MSASILSMGCFWMIDYIDRFDRVDDGVLSIDSIDGLMDRLFTIDSIVSNAID